MCSLRNNIVIPMTMFVSFYVLGLRGFQQLTGTTVILFFSKTIFDEADGFISSSNASIIYAVVQLVLCVVSTFTVDVAGRRPLLIISLAGTSLALFGKATFLYLKNCTDIDMASFNFLPLVALICFTLTYSIGMQTIPFLILGEIFPTNVKAFALCLMDVYYGIVVTIVSQFFYWSNDTFGMHVPFFSFAVCCIVGVIFIIFVIPETKGKTLEDIQYELQGQKRKYVGVRVSDVNKYCVES